MNNNETNKLSNTELYLQNIDYNYCLEKYINLLVQYTLFVNTEEGIIKNHEIIYYIYFKGLELINNVFVYILLYTKNIDLAYYNVQKSYYFYIEFINQIDEIQLTNLSLTCNDAIYFVYKKTIYNINEEYKKNIIINENKDFILLKKIISNINYFINNLICKYDCLNKLNNTKNSNEINNINMHKYINKYTKKILNIVKYKSNDLENIITQLNELINDIKL